MAGLRQLEIVEDAVQAAFMTALESWAHAGVPREPGSWLYRVAYNRLIGELRRAAGRRRILDQVADNVVGESDQSPPSYFDGEMQDDMLRMLFVCCHDAIPMESRLVLALKTLCGFSTAEIALRLHTTEANVHKAMREPMRKGGGVFHSDARMFTYHSGARAGSSAKRATSARGRWITISVSTSTGIDVFYPSDLSETVQRASYSLSCGWDNEVGERLARNHPWTGRG